jgi:hypothetical protein
MKSRLAAALVALFTAACQVPGGSAGCNTQIEWVDFIQVGSTQYLARLDPGSAVQESDMGSVYAKVKFKVSGSVCDPNYRLKDGDAAFLDPGTPIYQVNGFLPTQRLAVRTQGRLVVYVAGSPAPPSS